MADATLIVRVKVDEEGIKELDNAMNDARDKMADLENAVHRVRIAMANLTFSSTRERVDG